MRESHDATRTSSTFRRDARGFTHPKRKNEPQANDNPSTKLRGDKHDTPNRDPHTGRRRRIILDYNHRALR